MSSICVSERIFHPVQYSMFEWRYWKRFSLNNGSVWLKRCRAKRRFLSWSCKKFMKQKFKFNERFGSPKKRKAFDKMRLPKNLGNKFGFGVVISKRAVIR